jgi:uncharacterized membrane protein
MGEHDPDPAPATTDRHELPAWRRHTEGETILGCCVAVMAVAVLHSFLAERLLLGPRWLLPAVAVVLIVALVGVHPHRMQQQSPLGRAVVLISLGILAFSNFSSGARLVSEILGRRNGSADPIHLLLSGASIWLTNVIVFGLLYWAFDRGGPAARANATRQYTDFMFPQMSDPSSAPPGWEPTLVDYLYLAFTNATAFSPTDVMPLTRPAKMAMLIQSALSLVLIGLVLARAVNILAT